VNTSPGLTRHVRVSYMTISSTAKPDQPSSAGQAPGTVSP
jgi:hypothetical protein